MDVQDQPRKKYLQGHTWTGLLLLLIGAALLMKQSGFPFPHWLFGWPSLLIVIGLMVGVKHRFRDFSWLVMILIGGVFLADEIYPGLQVKQYAVPCVIIFLGLVFILAPKRRRFCRGRDRERFRQRFRERYQRFSSENAPAESAAPLSADAEASSATSASALDIVSVFSGVKKKVLSKNFKGGEVVCIFGGSEINLSNADFTSPITIDFVQIFGGTKLIVPANWEIRSEVAAVFGGIEDKRPQPPNGAPEKLVVLSGTVILGGVEVTSY